MSNLSVWNVQCGAEGKTFYIPYRSDANIVYYL